MFLDSLFSLYFSSSWAEGKRARKEDRPTYSSLGESAARRVISNVSDGHGEDGSAVAAACHDFPSGCAWFRLQIKDPGTIAGTDGCRDGNPNSQRRHYPRYHRVKRVWHVCVCVCVCVFCVDILSLPPPLADFNHHVVAYEWTSTNFCFNCFCFFTTGESGWYLGPDGSIYYFLLKNVSSHLIILLNRLPFLPSYALNLELLGVL